MHIIPKCHLATILTSDMYDPEQEFTEEMAAFAVAIKAYHPEIEYLVLTDHENGNDPQVDWPEGSCVVSHDVIPLTYAASGSYYGMSAHECGFSQHGLNVVFQCYLGGSEGASAPGFVITTARM